MYTDDDVVSLGIIWEPQGSVICTSFSNGEKTLNFLLVTIGHYRRKSMRKCPRLRKNILWDTAYTVERGEYRALLGL